MPIRINLLAEEKLAEELRRRDPVKRALVIVLIIAILEVVIVGFRQIVIVTKHRQLQQLQSAISMRTNTYAQILAAERTLNEHTMKLAALARLCTNRFLWGSFLNALQKSTAPGVQLLELKGEQTYTVTEEVRPSSEEGRKTPPKPATSTEKISIILRGKDENEGESIVSYIAALQDNNYLKQLLGPGNKIQLRDTSPPTEDPESKKRFVTFTLEIKLPDRVRQ